MTMITIQSQVTGILSLAACRLYGEPARSCNVRGPQPVTTLDFGKTQGGQPLRHEKPHIPLAH